MRIEVVRAEPGRAEVQVIELPAGATVGDALARFPAYRGRQAGIFGKVVGADHRLADGDRLEIYRALLEDPFEARRARARKARKR